MGSHGRSQDLVGGTPRRSIPTAKLSPVRRNLVLFKDGG